MIKKLHLSLVFIFILSFVGFAQSNDCDNSLGSLITVGSSCSPTTWNSTNNTDYWDDASGCNASDVDDVWGRFVATSTSTTITYDPITNKRAVLTLFNSACSINMSRIDCSVSSSNGNATTIVYNTTIGQTYRIRVQRRFSNANLNGTLCVYNTPNTVPQSGSNAYTLCSGNLYDNGGSTGNYANNSNGYTVLNPVTPGDNVQVSGTIITEGGWDYLTIYDGTGTGGTVLYGGSPHGSGASCNTFTVPTTTSTTGSLTVEFYSDGFSNCTGFDLNISCVSATPCATPTAQPPSPLTFGTIDGSSIAASFTTASPAPTNYLVLMNTTGTTPTPGPIDTINYTVGSTVGGATVIDTDADTNFTATGLSTGTQHYFFIYSFNDAGCSGGPMYYTTSPLTGNATTLSPENIVPNSGNNTYTLCSGNLYDNGGSTGNYANNSNGYTVLNPITPGDNVQVSGSIITEGGWDYLTIYDGTGTGGTILYGGSAHGSGASCNTFTVPNTTSTTGALTVQFYSDGSNNCAGFDLNISCVSATPCATPSAQPPSPLTFGTIDGSSIAASFTAASPAPTNYLVLMNSTGTTPTPGPIDTINYTVGSTVGGATVIDTDADTNFTATGLSTGTQYYFFIYSFNDAGCSGGPMYYTTSPLTGNATTLSPENIVPNSGNNTYTLCSGNLYDNGGSTGNYASNSNGYTVLNPITPGDNVQVSGSIITEGGWDYLTIYDGTGTGGTILYGGSAHGSGASCNTFTVPNTTSTTGALTVQFYSDGSNNCAGFNLSISCTGPTSPLTNDECMSATSLTVNPTEVCTIDTAGTTVGATQSTTSITCSGFSGNSSDDVWYSFTATDFNHDITVTPGSLGDFVLDLRSGACDGTSIDCADAVSSGNEVINASGLSIGTTYYVRVYSYAASGDEGTFDICVTSPGCTAQTTSDETRLYFTENEFIGTLNDVTNTSTYSSSPSGYQDFTGASNSIQAQGEGMNVFVEAASRGHIKAWVDWDTDGSFDDITEIVFDSGDIATASTTFGFVIPSSQTTGDYTIRIRIYNSFSGASESYGYNFNACENFNTLGSYTQYGETEDYSFTVIESCSAIINSITENENCGPGTVTLGASANFGSIYRWYANELDVAPIATTLFGSYTTAYLNTTTDFYVTADNGSCESLVRTKVTATIKPVPTLSFTPTIPEVCGEDDILQLTASATNEIAYLIDEDFEGTGLGVFTNNNIVDNGTIENNRKIWQQRTSVFIPSEEVWFPAISSGFGTNQFAMATSDTQPSASEITENALESSTLDSSNFIDLTLNFDIYFSKYLSSIPENVNIEVSTNGGTSWSSLAIYDDDIGYGTTFSSQSINMNAYINETNLKVRIRYYTDNWCDGVAVDNIQLFGSVPLTSSFSWAPASINAFLDPAATIPYVSGTTVSTVYIKPTTAQLQTNSFSFTATVTLNNGCNISENVSVTNNTKFWTGTSISDWGNPSRWSPAGIPTADNCIIIPDETVISGIAIEGYARNLTVKNTGNLLIESGNSLTVTEWINVESNGIFNIEDSASLIQIDDDANIGEVRIVRNSQPMYRYDYTYWASPMTAASGYVLDDLSPNTAANKFYRWIPTISAGHGNWTGENPNTTVMTPASGYAIRAPETFSTNSTIKTVFPALFVGTPNNGDVIAPIAVGTDATLGNFVGNTAVTADDDQWNFLGNPYPSAIDILSFLNETGNDVLLDGTAYLWTHNSPPTLGTADPFYGDYDANYTSNDFATVNSLGTTNTAASGGQNPTQYFASGQGFFVLGLGNGSAIFKNTMRVKNDNNSFFKTTNSTNSVFTGFEKHRIWLNLSNDNGAFSQILFGYAQGATNGWDRGKDGLSYGGNDVNFYTTAPDLKLTIQGKPLPFVTSDVVPLGYEALVQGQYRIGLDHFDPLFLNQPIFLNDKQLNIVHDLKSTPYTFNTNVGTFDNRFEIIYINQTLSTEDYAVDSNEIKVVSGSNLKVISQSKIIKDIEVYNILGKRLMTYTNVEAKTIPLNGIKKSNNALLLKIIFKDNTFIYKKVLY